MKKLLSVVIAAGVGFGAAFFMVSSQRDAVLKDKARLEAEWQAKVEALEKDLAAAKRRSGRVERVNGETTEVAVAARRSPKEILEKLLTLKPSGATRIPIIRKIVHELEDLAELKEEALPAIREFLAQNSDLDYSVERTDRGDDDRRRGGFPWMRSRAETEFTLPPSLRIGLFDVLKEIGGGNAEQVLAEVLQTSGRAVEVAYVARMLEEMAPTKYKYLAIEAAKSLLRNPLPIDSPNRLDEAAESYLYGILEMFGDTSFADEAKKLLISADGKLDRNVRDYLTKTQGEKAIPALYEAYKSGAISNEWERASIGSKILDYVGPNADANKFFAEILGNPDIDNRMKSFAIMRLAGGFGDAESPTDPKVISSRQELLARYASDLNTAGTADERLVRAIERTEQNLGKLANGEPIDQPFGNWGRGGDNDRGNRSNSGSSGSNGSSQNQNPTLRPGQ